MEVLKRDGKLQEFDKSKIIKAIKQANSRTSSKISDDLIETVSNTAVNEINNLNKDKVDVDDVHKAVENSLMECNCFDVARQYITYRQERDLKRFKKLPLVGIMESKLFAKDVVNQNANLDENSFGGRKGEMDSAFLKEHALNYYISPKFAKNHINNRVYIHDLDAYVLGMHNCFERKTKFITSEGIKSFENFGDGEEVTILTKDGEWSKATVHCYGKFKKMNEITLSRCGKEVTIAATTDHRWILKDGTVTTSLKEGDSLFLLPRIKMQLSIDNSEDANWWCLGFIIGDGVDHGKYTSVRLCGDKNKYSTIFEKAFFSVRGISKNGDKHYSKMLSINKQDFLNYHLWKTLSLKAKQLIFDGYISADGSKDLLSVSTADERIVSFIEDVSALYGWHIHSKKYIVRDTNYKKNAPIYSFRFTDHHSVNTTWKVVSIIGRKHHNDTAWCVEEPKTHSFTLANGIVTGNCLSVPMDELLSKGVVTRQTKIRPAGSINTAFQLVAVYFQLQSLQQFGGVSATHLDWTLVPYVRKSFYKHFKDGLKYVDDLQDKQIDHVLNKILNGKEITNVSIDDKLYKNYKKVWKYALDMTIKESNQAAEGLLHNLNSLQSRSGNQLPFSSINYGTCTLEEGRIVIKSILDATIKGTGNGQTSIFPCQIFQLMDGVNTKKGDKNYDLFKLAIKSTSMRMYPNYVNCDWSQDKGYNEVEYKTEFINSLSETQKETLIKRIQENPKLADLLGIDVVEN